MSLTVQPAAACELVVDDPDGDDNAFPCGAMSRFVVERYMNDPAYEPFEACEAHLADAVLAMADGDDEIPLIVTIRWNADPEPETDAQRIARVMTP